MEGRIVDPDLGLGRRALYCFQRLHSHVGNIALQGRVLTVGRSFRGCPMNVAIRGISGRVGGVAGAIGYADSHLKGHM